MLLDGGLREPEAGGNFLVGQEGGEPQTFFLTGAEALRHDTLRNGLDCYVLEGESSRAAVRKRACRTQSDGEEEKWCRLGDSNT